MISGCLRGTKDKFDGWPLLPCISLQRGARFPAGQRPLDVRLVQMLSKHGAPMVEQKVNRFDG